MYPRVCKKASRNQVVGGLHRVVFIFEKFPATSQLKLKALNPKLSQFRGGRANPCRAPCIVSQRRMHGLGHGFCNSAWLKCCADPRGVFIADVVSFFGCSIMSISVPQLRT